MNLSVIIPVYNVSQTLKRCVESVVSQSVSDCEIILVDDGSTDDSGTLCDSLARKYDEVKVIHRQNGGLSAARNTGLEMSTGCFVTFVDSDDYLAPGTYNPLLQILSQHPECDILEYNVQQDTTVEGRPQSWPYEKTFTKGRDYWLRGEAFCHCYACNKIYSRRILFTKEHANVRFHEGRVFEDVEFLAALLQYNPCVMTTSLGCYVYEWNEQGITAKAKGKQLRQLLDAQLQAARQLSISFSGKYVSAEEAPFYLAILNNQIDVCRRLGEKPRLESKKVHLSEARGIKMKLKVAVLNFFGIGFLCKIM